MRYLILSLICLGLSLHAEAQKQGNKWFFGHQLGLDFSNNPATAISGKTGTGGSSQEGTASICDTAGRLLFYTDGVNIFNSRHEAMMNGGNLNGYLTSEQSSIIIPLPGSDSLYYVFTSDSQWPYFYKTGPAGYNYSIVDMSLDRRSIDTTLGAVIPGWKNIHLVDSGTEKLCAASDGINGYWILGHRMFSDSFVAWHLNSAGLSAPVITRIGPFIGDVNSRGTVFGCDGQMKFSPDGKKVATINFRGSDSVSTLDVYDFNLITGQLSNHCQVPLSKELIGQTNSVRGLEFWPDGSKLFIGSKHPVNDSTYIIQFNLGPTCNSISSSRDTIFSRNVFRLMPYSIQAGPDGNLYVGWKDRMNYESIVERITKPDGPGGIVRYDTVLYRWNNQQVDYLPDLPSFVAGFRYHLSNVSVPAAGASAIKIQVSPNPVNQTLRLTATGTSGRLHATICDATGRQLTRCVLPAELDMSARPAGMYFYRVYSDRGMVGAGKFWVRH